MGRKEDGQVVPFGDLDDERFGGSLGVEVGRELEAQESSLAANDAVFAGVEAGRALEDLNAYLLLGGLFGGLSDGAGCDMEQKIAQTSRADEVWAFNKALD